MKNNKKNVTILLISLLVLAGSSTTLFEASAKRTFTVTVFLNPIGAGIVTGHPYSVVDGTAAVQNNQDQTIYIMANEGYAVQALYIDGVLKAIGDYSSDGGLTAEITFSRVKSDHTITLMFEVPNISTQFSDGSYQTSEQILLVPPQFLPPLEPVTPYYQIEITEGTLSGFVTVTVYLQNVPETDLRLYIGNPVDFNEDGTVNGNDIALIQEEAKKGIQEQNLEVYDLDHDGKVDSYDISIVKDYANSGLVIDPGHNEFGEDRIPWIDITTFSGPTAEGGWKVEGVTWHLSIFGCR